MPDGPEMVLRLTRTLARQEPRQPLPLRLCHAVVEAVDGRDGAISIGFTTSERSVLCATTEAAGRFEDAQDLMRQGPSHDVYRTGAAVASHSQLDRRRRWPTLIDALGDAAEGTVHALPMQPGTSLIGVLTVHHAAGVAIAARLSDLQFFADTLGAAIVGDLPGRREPGVLWIDRDRISQATGMVVAQLRLPPADALAVLRAHAFAQATSLIEISRRVVAREVDFGPGADGGPR